MKRTRIYRLFAATALAVLILSAPGAARIVTRDEARNIAENYIALIVEATGGWGETTSASVGDIEELRRGERLLGYWCHIEPAGHIVVSLHDELAPVKASSETWDGDPSCEGDMFDVIKIKIEQEHDYIEARIGPVETAPPGSVADLCEIDYRDDRDLLSRDPEDFERSPMLTGALADYQEGGVMLTASWNQTDPYNLFMPATSACTPAYDGRCAAGCVAIAAGQIMKYWDWPPFGVGTPYDDYYDWTLMPDQLTPSSPYQQIDETALFIVEIGQACNMNYCKDGECGSSAQHEDMRTAFMVNFRFSGGTFILQRTAYSSEAWFDMIRNNLNLNMPLQYGVPDHSIVCDGWRIISDIRQYHMNYGWGGWPGGDPCWNTYTSSNVWFTLDALPCTEMAAEEVFANLKPAGSLGATLSGTYAPYSGFPYHYVNVDTGGESAVFQAGQLIQSLPGLRIRCTSVGGGAVKFYGSPALHTRLFTRGDTSKGVKIVSGCVALYGGGAARIY